MTAGTMEISFQHVNPAGGHQSTLLRVDPGNGRATNYLIDAGEGVHPGAFLGSSEALDGVFLTHVHNDHFMSLNRAVTTDPETRVYTTPATAALVRQAYPEADRYQDLGDFAPIGDALTPIDSWTRLEDGIYVLPLPAGHTPGASAFLFRIDDSDNTETVTILATGDFTARRVAGFGGLEVPESIDIDVMIANAATSPSFEENLQEALEVVLERALGGATTLVATTAITGVHAAYLVGHLLEHVDRELPIHLVGQSAKLYAALDFEVPFVSVHPQFEDTTEVVAPGAITIAGPEVPDQGSTGRLYDVVQGDDDAVFVQLATSGPERVESGACAARYFDLSNHPTEDVFVDAVEKNLPRHLILKHVSESRAKTLGSQFDNLFYWSNSDKRSHVLYEDGDWHPPNWIDPGSVSRIRRRNYRQSGSRVPIDRPIEDLPTISLSQRSPDLADEGVDLRRFEETFETAPTPRADPSSASETGEGAGGTTGDTDGASNQDIPNRSPAANHELLREVSVRLDSVESTLDDHVDEAAITERLDSGFETLEDDLGDLAAEVRALPEEIDVGPEETVTGTVIRQEDLVLFRVDGDALRDLDLSLDHQQSVELAIVADQEDE